MSVPYRFITRNVANRINAIVGTTTAQLEAAYITSPLTATQAGSPIFSFTGILDLVMLAESKFAGVIANSSHPYRSVLRGVSSAIANETPVTALLPTGFVGTYGAVYDSSDGTPCLWRPLSEVSTRSRNSGSFFRSDVYWWNLNGETMYHTRTSVIMECCVYNEATQRAVLVANGNMLLPDDMEPALTDEALRQAFRDDEFIMQAEKFGQIADSKTEEIRSAKASVAA